jgi:hypothetical protein
MAQRTRIAAYGSAVALIVLGVPCGLLIIGGKAGDVVAASLVTLGLGAILLLVFLEIGLSEDRDRAKEEEQRREDEAKRAPRPPRITKPRRPS